MPDSRCHLEAAEQSLASAVSAVTNGTATAVDADLVNRYLSGALRSLLSSPSAASSRPLVQGMLDKYLQAAQARYSEKLILIPGMGAVFVRVGDIRGSNGQTTRTQWDRPVFVGQALSNGTVVTSAEMLPSYLSKRKPGTGSSLDDPIVISLAWSAVKLNQPHMTRIANVLLAAQRRTSELAAQKAKEMRVRCAALLRGDHGGIPPTESEMAECSDSMGAPRTRHLFFHVRFFSAMTTEQVHAAQALWNSLHQILRVADHPPGALHIEIALSKPFPSYLAALANSHISFDSYPFAGCNSMHDLLWAGVPIVSLVHASQDEMAIGADPALALNFTGVDELPTLEQFWIDRMNRAARGGISGIENEIDGTKTVGAAYLREMQAQRQTPIPMLWRSSIGASMLHRSGLDPLIARDEEDFLEKTVALLTDYDLRSAWRKRILSSDLDEISRDVDGTEAYADVFQALYDGARRAHFQGVR
jgi:hypothetical protein